MIWGRYVPVYCGGRFVPVLRQHSRHRLDPRGDGCSNGQVHINNRTVIITVKPEEHELGSLQTHGTYEEIKKYVLDKYSLKISALNISQAKRKCGLDGGEAFNKSKNDSRIPNCTNKSNQDLLIFN